MRKCRSEELRIVITGTVLESYTLRQTLRHFLIMGGGAVWDSNVFFNQLLTGQHLAYSQGAS